MLVISTFIPIRDDHPRRWNKLSHPRDILLEATLTRSVVSQLELSRRLIVSRRKNKGSPERVSSHLLTHIQGPSRHYSRLFAKITPHDYTCRPGVYSLSDLCIHTHTHSRLYGGYHQFLVRPRRTLNHRRFSPFRHRFLSNPPNSK